MTINFSDLVTLYREVTFQGSSQAEYCIENAAMLSLIETLTSYDNSILTHVEVLQGSLQIGQTINLEVLQPKPSIGWLYNNVDNENHYHYYGFVIINE